MAKVKVKQLIERLEAEGEVESQGEFTLDREKAKVKMRQFQLAEPDRYVLLLVQAAILKGATRVDFDIDADDMRMSFDGEPFDATDVEELYTSLFGSKRDPSLRPRRELAMALNAAMGLNPRFAVLESGDGERGIRLELRPEREDVVQTVEGMAAGTRIHVKDQFRPGLLIRFVRDLQGEILEEKRLCEHCKWATVPIYLDGDLISQQVPLADAAGRVELRSEDAAGVAGFVNDGEWRARVHVLNNGVWLAEHELPGFPLGFRAVVDGTALEKDVSQTDVVRNAAYHRLLRALREACDASILHACAEYQRRGQPWLTAVLRGALYREANTIARDLGNEPHVDALCDLPLWCDAAGEWVSTRRLLDASHPGYSTKPMRAIELPEGRCIVLAQKDDEQRFFGLLADGRVADRTSYLARMVRNEENRRVFRKRHQPPVLASARYLGRVPVESEHARGEIGIVEEGNANASIRLVLDECLLCEINPKFPIAGVVAVLEAELTPRADYKSAARDDALAACVRVFGEGLAQVMTQVAAQHFREPLTEPLRRLLMGYMIMVSTPGFRAWLFRQFGFGTKSARRRADRAEDWAVVPDLRVHGPHEDANEEEEQLHPLTEVRVFETADGRMLPLAALDAAIERDGQLAWIDRGQPPVNQPARFVVRVTELQRRVLEHVFGAAKLVDCADDYAEWVEHEKFLMRPRAALELHEWTHARIEFEVEGLRGVIGLAGFTLSMEGDTPVVPEMGVSADMVYARLLLDDRLLCDHWFTVGVPGLVATLAGTLIVPNATYSDLEGDTWVAVANALAVPVARLIARLAELHATKDMPDAVRHALSFALVSTFGSPRMVHAFSRLRAREGDAIEAYAALQRLCIAYTSEDVAREVRSLLRENTDPTPEAVEQRLRRRGEEPGAWYEPDAYVRAALISAFEPLSRAPLFSLAGQGDASFSTLLQMRAKGRIPWVDRRLAAQIGYAGERRIAVVDDVQKQVLERLFGPRGIEDATAWLEQWYAEQQLAQRQRLEQLRVPASAMLAVLEVRGELQGEIGLPRARPRLDSRSFVQLCRDRRPLCTLELAHTVPVSAVLDWSELEVEQGADGLLTTTSECAGWVASRIEDELDALMDVLAGRPLSRVDADQARIYVLMYLADRLRRAGLDDPHLKTGPVSRVAALPVFEDVEGELRTLLELARAYEARGKLSYLTTTPFDRPRDRIVVRARYDELDLWRVLFPELVDYAFESEQERKIRQRKAMLAPLRSEPPPQALCFRRVEANGLEGILWIEAGQGADAAVDLGREGLAVGSVVVDPIFCCRGSIQGPAVGIADDWVYFEIGDAALRELSDRALEMYEQLVEDTGALGEGESDARDRRPGTVGAVGWILHAVSQGGRGPVRVLREATLRLHAHRHWGSMTDRERAVYRRLCELPLFALSTGRLVSLCTAVRERPFELAHLNLWSDEEVAGEGRTLVESLVVAQRERAHRGAAPPAAELATPPRPAPPVRPPPPAPTPEERLLDAIRSELRVVRTANQNILSDAHLDLIELDRGGRRLIQLREQRVIINVAHPVFVQALEAWEEDRVRVSFLACVVYTGLNVLLTEIVDAHEVIFHRVHATHMLSAVLTEPAESAPAEPDDAS